MRHTGRGTSKRPAGRGGWWAGALVPGLVLLALARPAAGAEPKASEASKVATRAPAPAAAAAGENADPVGLNRVLPEVNVSEVSLDDFLAFLQDVSPKFKAVIVRDPDVAPGYPFITMRLRNVPLGQLLDVLTKAYPDISLEGIDGATPDGKESRVYVVKVQASDRATAQGGRGGATVKVYRLGGAVKAVAEAAGAGANKGMFQGQVEPKEVKEALNHVLSLIKATLSQIETGRNPPVLQVHEETQTLIFKGSAEQRAVLEDALAALDPAATRQTPEGARLREEGAKLREEVATLQQQLLAAKADAALAVDRLAALMTDMKMLQIQRDELTQRLKEAEQKAASPSNSANRPSAKPDAERSGKEERAPKEDNAGK